MLYSRLDKEIYLDDSRKAHAWGVQRKPFKDTLKINLKCNIDINTLEVLGSGQIHLEEPPTQRHTTFWKLLAIGTGIEKGSQKGIYANTPPKIVTKAGNMFQFCSQTCGLRSGLVSHEKHTTMMCSSNMNDPYSNPWWITILIKWLPNLYVC